MSIDWGAGMSERFTEADRRLAMADSHNRAPLLLAELQAESDDDVAREMLAEWLNICDAFQPQALGLREQMIRVGFFTDGQEPMPSLPVRVYRGAWDDDRIETALSWTLSREVAERFGHGLVSMRAKLIFGIHRPDNVPTIWQATCLSALGWLTSRGEEEVIVGEVCDVIAIAQLERSK